MLRLAIFTVLLPQALATDIVFKDCGSKGALHTVGITPCNKPARCVLLIGDTSRLSIAFTNSVQITALKLVASTTFWGQTVPIPVDNNDACRRSGLACPIPAGSSNTYYIDVPFDATYPTTDMIFNLRLRDQNGDDQTCATFNVTVTERRDEDSVLFD